MTDCILKYGKASQKHGQEIDLANQENATTIFGMMFVIHPLFLQNSAMLYGTISQRNSADLRRVNYKCNFKHQHHHTTPEQLTLGGGGAMLTFKLKGRW